jgi:hypothetical protein
VPASLILAEDALAHGDLAAAAENLGLVEPEALPEAALAGFRRARDRVAGLDRPADELVPTAETAVAPPPLPAAPAEPADEVAPEVEALAAPTAAEPTAEALAPLQAADDDPVASVLRAQAGIATGPDRAALLERLAGHHERSGRQGPAADALLEALAADPHRDLSWGWLAALTEHDEPRQARAAALHLEVFGPPPEAAATPAVAEAAPAPGEPALAPAVEPGAEATPEPPPEPQAEGSADASAARGSTAPWLSAVSEPAHEPTPAPAAAPPEPPDAVRHVTAPWLSMSELPPPPLELDLGLDADLAGPPAAPPAPPSQQPYDRAAELRTLLREHAAAGNRRGLAAIAEEAEAALGAEPLRPYAAQLGRAALEVGRNEEAHRWLTLARQDDPAELTVARDLSRAAERTGRHAEEVELGELCADAIAAHDPLAAAARYRHFARVLATKVGDPGAAASMLEKALTLVPDDADGRRELWALWGRRRQTQGRALEAWLDAARADPSDATALLEVAALSERLAAVSSAEVAARLMERSRLAASLAAFASPGHAAPPLRLAAVVPDVARDRVAAPGALGPLGRLLALLAPYLEPLFPADLARRGATSADRLAPPRAPVVRDALEAAGRILGARPYVGFLVDRPGVDLQVENTQPPALVIPAGVEALPAAAVHFLAARAIDLLGRGWALTGKFAPKDVGILLELACRFAGGVPPPLGLPPQRADAFLSALLRSVPPSVASRAAPLGPGAAEELASSDVRALASAIRRTGARVALLVTGDPGAALAALLLLEKQRPATPDAKAALALPDLRDLALLALSDPFLDIRVAVVG